MLEADRLGKYVQSVGFFCCYEKLSVGRQQFIVESIKKYINVFIRGIICS